MSRLDPSLRHLLKQTAFSSPGFIFVSFIVPIVAWTEFGATGYQMGILFAMRRVGFILGSPLAGWLSDQRSRRHKLVLIGGIARTLNYILMYLALVKGEFWLATAAVLLLGAGGSFFWAPIGATVADATEYKHRSEAYGYYNQRKGVGTFIGSGIGFFIYSLASERDAGPEWLYCPLILFAVSNLYGGLLIHRLLPKTVLVDIEDPDTESSLSSEEQNERNQFRRRLLIGFGVLLGLSFVQSLIGALVAPFLQVFLLKNITDDPILLILMFVPGSTLSVLIAPTMGRLADRFQPKWWLLVTGLLGALTTWFLIHSTEPWQVSLLFTIDATVVASSGYIVSKLISNVSKRRRGTIFGLSGAVSRAGAISGPLIGGALWHNLGDRAPFLMSIFTEAVMAVAYPVIFATFGFDRESPSRTVKRPETSGSLR